MIFTLNIGYQIDGYWKGFYLLLILYIFQQAHII